MTDDLIFAVLGNAFTLCMHLIGYTVSYHCNGDLRKKIDELEQSAEQRKNDISSREHKHVKAVVRMSKLDWNGAAQIWEESLTECPTDMLALKMAFYMYFFTGQKQRQFESMDRSFPHFQNASTVNS